MPEPRTDADPVRFAFGDNWRRFLESLDDQRIAEAEKSLQALLDRPRLNGLSFLDIGSGSGLFSLAARRLGASVHSFDYDPNSVECGVELRRRYFPGDPRWTVERGSILDPAFLATLDRYDVVYSWGVLHHTGAMQDAVANAASVVKPGGEFAFALYRKTLLCGPWTRIKRWYAAADPAAQQRAREAYTALLRFAFRATRRDFEAHVAQYRNTRGMDFERDLHDWMGGYPYESIRPAAVAAMMGKLGFEPVRSTTRGLSVGLFGSGCDEYVYRRR